MIRTIDEWVEIIGKADATNEGDHKAAARTILRDVIHYKGNAKHFEDDVAQLANAMLAYVKLYQIHGVKVP